MSRARRPEPKLGETPVMTRQEAAMGMHTQYFDGNFCVNGHLDWRATSTGQCRSCQRPPIVAIPYLGLDSRFKAFYTPRLRVPGLPRNEFERKELNYYLELAGRQWAWQKGLSADKPDPDEVVIL